MSDVEKLLKIADELESEETALNSEVYDVWAEQGEDLYRKGIREKINFLLSAGRNYWDVLPLLVKAAKKGTVICDICQEPCLASAAHRENDCSFPIQHCIGDECCWPSAPNEIKEKESE